MTSSQERGAVASWLLIGVVLVSLAVATPWATPLRQSITPSLPRFVVITATLVGMAQLVHGLVVGFGRRGGWSAAALPMALGISALLMALSFLPGEAGVTPRLLPLIGAAAFAVGAAAMQRRAREREGS
ncbi:MAG TPA: hypothetical protein VK617_04710 [Gemmatimonadaceae bacterium]|nr:hypothetical protein [Gemmatimonadaceae bacterium]